MVAEIRKTKTGNCGCFFCGRTQEGLKMHPYTVWHKEDDQRRGQNDPVCSIECAKAQLLRLKA